ncbi:MAG: hypothetical protein ABIG89_03450 [Candidatus Woesearchaeota archaeon]
MRITIDTDNDSKDEIKRVIGILQRAVRNSNCEDFIRPKQQNNFDLGCLNFNEIKNETKPMINDEDDVDLDKLNASLNNQKTQLSEQKTIGQPTKQPDNVFGAMFCGGADFVSNAMGDNNDNPDGNSDENKQDKDDDWGPRTKITLADLERY